MSMTNGSNSSLAFSCVMSATIFLDIAFLISTMAFYRFLGSGSLRACRCSSAPSMMLLNCERLMALSLICSWALWMSSSTFCS